MDEQEDILRERTWKGQTAGLDRRIFYTLTEAKALQNHSVAKAITLTLKALVEKGILNEQEIDEILLETTR